MATMAEKKTSVRGLAKLAVSAARRFGLVDAWENVATGLGGLDDRLRSHAPRALTWLTESAIDALYHRDDMARVLVDDPPETAFSRGFDLTFAGELDSDEVSIWTRRMQTEMDRLGAHGQLLDAFVWGRKDGRGGLLVGANDGQALDQPLNVDTIRSIDYLEPLEKWQFVAVQIGDQDSAWCGRPEIWGITRANGSPIRVHASRILLTRGPRTTRNVWQSRGYANMSVLDSAYEALQGFDSGYRTAGVMLTDASKLVMKISGFLDLLGSKDAESFAERMSYIAQGSSIANILPIDAQDEDVAFHDRSFSGVDGMLDRLQQRLAAAARRPVSVLMGRSPAGMNATGESDLSCWYDQVQAYQRNEVTEQAVRLVQLVAHSIGAPEPGRWGVSWPALWQMTPVERAAHQKAVAEVDKIYLDAGVLLPEEVAIARFGGKEWSDKSPQINVEERQRYLEMAAKREEAMLSAPPVAPAPPVPAPVEEPEDDDDIPA